MSPVGPWPGQGLAGTCVVGPWLPLSKPLQVGSVGGLGFLPTWHCCLPMSPFSPFCSDRTRSSPLAQSAGLERGGGLGGLCARWGQPAAARGCRPSPRGLRVKKAKAFAGLKWLADPKGDVAARETRPCPEPCGGEPSLPACTALRCPGRSLPRACVAPERDGVLLWPFVRGAC